MARNEIDIGIEGNDGTGDSIRESFKKVNQNFTELYAVFGLGGTIAFKSLDDTPNTYLGNEGAIPAVADDASGVNFYKFVSDSGGNNTDKGTPSESTNSVYVEFTQPVDPTQDAGTVKITIVDPHINRDPDPELTAPLNAGAVMAYNNDTNTILRNTGVGNTITDLVSDWNTTHSGASTISADNVILSRGYADDRYVNVDGDTMTGALNVPSGNSGTKVPQTQEVITRAGTVANRTMLDTLYLSDHPTPLEGFGTPNGQDDLQAVTKLYVDTQGYASTTNIFVSPSGDDAQSITPPGQEGRSMQYAYKTINAAMAKSTEIIEATPYEPGPYVQVITHGSKEFNAQVDTVSGVISPAATSDLAGTIVDTYKNTIADNVIEYINTTYPDLVYNQDLCRRDVLLILESVKLDVQAGGNYLSRWAGKRYHANPSAIKARSTQYTETVAGINKARTDIASYLTSAGTISSPVITAYDDRFDDIITFLNDSTADDAALVVGSGYAFEIDNGGNASVDQAIAGNPDLREGKIIRGKLSGATGVITDYQRAYTGSTDRVVVELKEPINFIVGEELEFGNITQNNQITVFVESGIYYEHLPIKLPENVSIKGDEFRRCVIRPKPGVSQSRWANTYFYRDINIDGLPAVESPVTTLTIVSGADASRAAGVYNIAKTDYATSAIGQDATFQVTVDGTGTVTLATIVTGGTGFTVGETIIIPDSNLGSGGAADVTLTVTATGGGYHFTHPVSGKQGKYGYHYLQDSSKSVNVGTDGADNPGGFNEGARLVELNKAFIQEEVIQWIDAQITGGAGIWSGFTYNSTKCRRDTGLIIDGFVNDLKVGGRENTLTNQGAYYEGAVAGEEAQTAAAITYIKTIVTSVLANDVGAPFTALGAVPQVFDSQYTAEVDADVNFNNLVDCIVYAFDAAFNPPKRNNEMDVLLCNDNTIVRNLTVQRHGGFMMTLDPEGQILTRSPYCQTGSSFSQSKGTERSLAGGLFADGYAGNMPAQITNVNSAFSIDIQSPTDQGLFVRRPPTPFPFFYNGARYQVNTISNYSQAAGTCTLVLDETSNDGTGWASGTGIDIFIQSGGNRSMLANDFTQINDLGFGAICVNNALSELVSMFTYYCHTGYLAKDGSQIRSIAGNNSYGFYGLVADGADPDEIPTDVTLAADMVFPGKVFRASHKLTFASVPGSIAVGETISQEITGATGVVSFFKDGGTTVFIHSATGNWNTSDEAFGDDSATLIGVPTSVTSVDLDADTGSLFLYAYDLAGLPNNVSEAEIYHGLNPASSSDLYQPYEITNAQQADFILDGYTDVNDVIAATYTGASPETSKATFTITKDRTNNYGVIITAAGAGYSSTETFVVSGALLGGTTPANDATITVSTVGGSGDITGATIAGTPAFDAQSPVLSGQVWRFNFGTGIEGTADNGLQEDTPHDIPLVIRHKQNFVVDGLPVEDLPVRPSTAFVFTDDDTDLVYRTIAFTNTITDGYVTGSTSRVVTFDSNYRYIDLTVSQDHVTAIETTVDAVGTPTMTVDPNYVDIITAAGPSGLKTLGGTVADRFIAINPLDASAKARLAGGEIIFTWAGKVHQIDAYAEYDYDDGIGSTETIGVIQISDVGSDVNWPATASGLAISVQNTRGITLKGGLTATEAAQITVNISTCRATGHDMLDIGVGGYNTANYPERIFGKPYGTVATSTNDAFDENGTKSAAQAQERRKGRVFSVLTDQDGFFRVGRFFTVDQGTGSVTFNAALVLTNIDGIGFKRGVRVNEFSNDDTFSDAKGDAVPTQTAVEGYINQRLGFDRDGNLTATSIGPGVMSLGGPGYTATPMADDMNLGGFKIQNVALPTTGSDAANKTYVDSKTDELNDIGDVTITPSVGIGANVLGFTGTGSNSENMVVGGDISFTYTGANSLTAAISSGVIVNNDVNASAAIAQSKLAMNAATTRANATGITQADRGLASFDSANFEITDGWVGIKAGGISNTELANSSITIGSTSISLGGSSTSLAGMTGIAFTSGSVSGTANWSATGSISNVSTITHTGNITGPLNSGTDNGVSIGSSTRRYNTVWATTFNGEATAALYADLAENYLGDAAYEPGTVLVFGGNEEVTLCSAKGDRRAAGVVTTNPAHLMNSALQGEHVVGLALQGRVPCKVIGKVAKGDLLVTSAVPGFAIVDNDPKVGTVIGKAVGTKDDMDRGIVEVVVGRV
jgi:hypothetical protein